MVSLKKTTLRLLLGVSAMVSLTAPTLVGCMSHEILPEKIEVKVSRDEPSKNCKLVGPVSGTVSKIGENSEKALENLKTDAARKGANFVQYGSASATGTALQGTGYYCP